MYHLILLGEEIEVIECFNEKEEAEFINNTILSFEQRRSFYSRNGGLLSNECAQSRTIEDQLRRANIPYRVVEGLSSTKEKKLKICWLIFALL